VLSLRRASSQSELMQELPASPSDGIFQEADSASASSAPQLLVDVADTFNYAAWQNAVPLLRCIAIDNTQGHELSAITLELRVSNGFARDKRWTIDRVNAGAQLTLNNLDLEIDPKYLDSLDEAERTVLTFQLLHKGKLVHEYAHTIRVLARDEWGGMSTMGDLLPAFVMPNEPALAALLRSAATVLNQHGHPTALDGYKSGDPNRAYLLAASL